MHHIVVVGGGTGTHTVLRGLRTYVSEASLTAIVSMADSGGSTGRLRDQFGQLPVGDVRNALTALAAEGDEHDLLLRKMFEYRFQKGDGLVGHNFGNLFLTVLTDILGSEEAAIVAAGKILRVNGRVVPVTTDHIDLIATYSDGDTRIGEHAIDTPLPAIPPGVTVTQLSLTTQARLSRVAKIALQEATCVVIGPGDLYTSIIPNLIIDGFVGTLKDSSAILMYVCNVMTKQGQTIGMDSVAHVKEITRYLGRYPDVMVVNTTPIPEEALLHYATYGETPVLLGDVRTLPMKILALPVLDTTVRNPVHGDAVVRSLIRHDADALAQGIMNELRGTLVV